MERGNIKGAPIQRGGYRSKMIVLSLVERGGNVRSFHIQEANVKTIKAILTAKVSPLAHLMTDDAPMYKGFAIRTTARPVCSPRWRSCKAKSSASASAGTLTKSFCRDSPATQKVAGLWDRIVLLLRSRNKRAQTGLNVIRSA